MNLKSFKRTILKRLPAKWSRHKQAEEAFAACLECFNPRDIEMAGSRAETFGAFPWMLLVSVLIELLKWWLENRDDGQRTKFRAWQKEVKAIR